MKYFIFILILIISNDVLAGGWTEPLTIERVFTEGNSDTIAIYTSGGVESVSGCVANSWIFAAENEDRRNRAFSMAMAALASGRKVSFWYQDSCTNWSYHGATSVQLHK